MKTMKNTLIGLAIIAIISIFGCPHSHGSERAMVAPDRPMLNKANIGVYNDPLLLKLTEALVRDFQKTPEGSTNALTKTIEWTPFAAAHTMFVEMATNSLEAAVSPRKSQFWNEDLKFVRARVGFAPSTEVFCYLQDNPIYFVYDPLKATRWEPFVNYLRTARAQAIIRTNGFTMTSFSSRP